MLSDNEADSIHSIRVAPAILTTLSFEDSEIDTRALQLEGRGSRVKLVGTDEHTVVLKPLVELGKGERILLVVHFTDGRVPTQATFALVAHPAEVDSQIEVVREAQSAEACQAELADAQARLVEKDAELQTLRARAAANGPAGLILAGLLTEEGVKVVNSQGVASLVTQEALQVVSWSGILSFRAAAWAAVSVGVKNTGAHPWTPGSAKLTSTKTSRPVAGASIRMEKQQLGPGESAVVVVVTEPPSKGTGELFTLELFGADGGRALSINGVQVHNPEGQKQ